MPYAVLNGGSPVIALTTQLDRASEAEKARLNNLVHAYKVVPLGGSRSIGHIDEGLTGMARDALPIELDGVLLAGLTIRARIWAKTESASTSITPRIYDVTAAADHVVGTPVVATAWDEGTPQDLTLTLPAATHFYRLEWTKSDDTNPVWMFGYLEFSAP